MKPEPGLMLTENNGKNCLVHDKTWDFPLRRRRVTISTQSSLPLSAKGNALSSYYSFSKASFLCRVGEARGSIAYKTMVILLPKNSFSSKSNISVYFSLEEIRSSRFDLQRSITSSG